MALRQQISTAPILNSVLLLCEQLEDAMPHQYKSEHYITPVLQWMTQEWKVVKKRIADFVVAAAIPVPMLEDIGFPTGKQNLMYKQLRSVMEKYKVDTKGKISEAAKLARGDTVPKLVAGTQNVTTVMLSKQGMQEVVDGLKFQKDFVDDLGKSTEKRVRKLLQGRYGDVASFRKQVNRSFRIDRDATLANFHAAVRGHAESVIAGRITPESFQNKMQGSIKKFYGQMYRDGKGTPLESWEKDFVKRQVDSQTPYLQNFRGYIEQKKALGQELTGRITQRASLYAERGTSLFEAGHVGSLPDDALVDWTMQPAEHCRTCPAYARNNPYTKGTLPGYPGEGFHLTQCGTNCKCIVTVSDLYVTEFPESPETDLAIKVTTPKPPPPTGTPVRTSADTVEYGNKTYIRTKPTRGGRTVYTEIDKTTGEQRRLFSMELPKEVGSAYRKKFTPPVVKPKAVKRPKPPPPPKPKVIPKAVEPSEEVREAMGKPKYAAPEDVRKDILRKYQQHDELKDTIRAQQDELRKDLATIKEQYETAGKTVVDMRKDPKYVATADKMYKLNVELREHSKELRASSRKLVQTSAEGFQIKTYAEGTVRGFEKKVKNGVGEFSKLIDEDLIEGGRFSNITATPMGKRYRSSYKPGGTLQLADDETVKFVIHEAGHWLEENVARVGSQARNFLKNRTVADVTTSLNGVKETTAFAKAEVTKKDKFVDPYMGRIYRGGATEIVSMGLQMMYENPYKLAKKDPGMFDFIYKVVRGMPL